MRTHDQRPRLAGAGALEDVLRLRRIGSGA
jgi:hypothetical protein